MQIERGKNEASRIKRPRLIDTSDGITFDEGSVTLTSKANSRQKTTRDKVTYWAGLRFEGALTPFEKRDDEHSKWHEGIANG